MRVEPNLNRAQGFWQCCLTSSFKLWTNDFQFLAKGTLLKKSCAEL